MVGSDDAEWMLTCPKDFIGVSDGDVHQFYGIPFAKPPYVTPVIHLSITP